MSHQPAKVNFEGGTGSVVFREGTNGSLSTLAGIARSDKSEQARYSPSFNELAAPTSTSSEIIQLPGVTP